LQTLFFQALVGTVVLAVVLPWVWQPLGLAAFGLIGVMALISITGHGLLIRAYDHAPAADLAPFTYFEIVSATALGLWIFGDFPDPMTWAGIGVIVASGVYISFRERHRN
jgi:drug/metabolite transporter (DMT)-like permease